MTSYLAQLRRHVDDRTPLALEEHLAPLAGLGGPLDELLTPARLLARGGKRFRAQLCAAGWLAGDPEDALHPALVHAGAALELFQAAALVHDDIIDQADTRRGHPAAHRALAAVHTDASWRGDASHFGTSAAILLGDVLLAASSAELARGLALLEPARATRAREVYDEMCIEVAVGQYLDVRAENLPWDTPGATREAAIESALQVVRHKSAKYSVEQPLALGAAMAGVDRAREEKLRAVGLAFGEAFQLRDDELGVFGEPATTGKPAGDDLREGKRTVLLALTLHALDSAAADGDTTAADRAALVRELVGHADLTADQVDQVRRIMTDSGALVDHEDVVAQRRDAGFATLADVDVPARAREVLTVLGTTLTTRTA